MTFCSKLWEYEWNFMLKCAHGRKGMGIAARLKNTRGRYIWIELLVLLVLQWHILMCQDAAHWSLHNLPEL